MPAEIIELHSRNDGIVVSDIPEQIIAGLSEPLGRERISTMLLYDERSLRLYDDITTEVAEYYLFFFCQKEILKTNADDFVQTTYASWRRRHHRRNRPGTWRRVS